MAQIRNKTDIKNSIADEALVVTKKLPNFFDTKDEINPVLGMVLSGATHIAIAALMICFSMLGFFDVEPPELPKQDIEFKLVDAPEKPPINKNTKIRSDRNSQAGGKHDPNRPISQPSAPQAKSAPAKAPSPAPKAAQPKKSAPAPKQTVQPKVQPKTQPQPQKTQTAPQKPTSIKAPTAAKPSINPSAVPKGVEKPSAPKITTAPKSPFTVTAPSTGAPVGKTYKPQGSPQGGGSSSGSGGSGTGAPAPVFSSKSGTGSGYGNSRTGSGSGGSGQYGSRGSSGGYGAGNPSPGNPNGTPGIDAIKQPNWGPYMRELEQRIKRNWSPPKGDTSKRVVITFTIGKDGRLLSRKITKSSGVPLADQAAMSAIELTAPFKPLPPEFKGTSVPIEFTFDYNVLNSVLR